MSPSARPTTQAAARALWRRSLLWFALIALVAGALALLIWLAGRYELEREQQAVERDAQQAAAQLRGALSRHVQSLSTLLVDGAQPQRWQENSAALLRQHREVVRVEWRDAQGQLLRWGGSPFEGNRFAPQAQMPPEMRQACETAARAAAPSFGPSHFAMPEQGLGLEVIHVCFEYTSLGRVSANMLATIGLQSLLAEQLRLEGRKTDQVALTEADGTRLAAHGRLERSANSLSARQLVDLPGATLVLRLDRGRKAPDLFPNVLTALVGAMTLALGVVMALLVRDSRLRHQAQSDLGNALALRKAMEDSLVTGLRARDLNGQITYVNPAFCDMVGYSAMELLGTAGSTSDRRPAPYWPPELVDEYLERQSIRFSAGSVPRDGYESIFVRKNGERFAVHVFEAPLIDAKGEQTGWMSTVLDVSRQKSAEEQNRAIQDKLGATSRLATVGEMATLMSHELNQPLSAIASYANGAMNMIAACADFTAQNGKNLIGFQGEGLQGDLTLALRRIAEQAERAGKVIRSVNDVVRRREREREVIEAQALIESVMPLIDLQARKTGVMIRCVVASGAQVLVDRTMAEQVLLNLARNGIQAMDGVPREHRELTLRVIPSSGPAALRWWRFEVIDRGHGVPRDVAEQLFTPFFSTKPEGMGLGLSLCRTVIEQHGGTLEHRANAPQGTVFAFTLPAA